MKRALLLFTGTLCLSLNANAAPAEQAAAGLVAEYYAFDEALTDFPSIPQDKKPTLKRVDQTINVDSTEEAWPGTQLTDHFYVRWSGKLRAPKDGKYAFFLESDDGSCLCLDGKPVVDNSGLHGMSEETGEIELKAGEHELKVEFFENDGGAGCKFSWQPPGGDKEIVPSSALLPRPGTGPGKSGLRAEIFALDESIEDFPNLSADKKPTLTRVDANINVSGNSDAWPGTQLNEHYFIRWTGKVHVLKPGGCTFFLESDDGSRLFVDGKQVVDNNGLHGMDEKSGQCELSAGAHDLKVEFFQNEGENGCKLSWQPPGKDKQVIPSWLLSH